MVATSNEGHWFQSRLSRPGAACHILEGTDFRNKNVAVAETPEIAARIVRAVNAYDSMLAALKAVEKTLKPTDPAFYLVTDAIRKAEVQERNQHKKARADYHYEERDGFVLVYDDGNPEWSVTNDAENVVLDLVNAGIPFHRGCRLLFLGQDELWCEIKVENGRFARFLRPTTTDAQSLMDMPKDR
jgi:hypothetical protein